MDTFSERETIDRQELANRLLDYFQTAPELPEYLAEPPESLPAFDPYQMVGEWIALRQEIKQQNKLFQSTNIELQQSLDLERSRNEQLQLQLTAPTPKTAEDPSSSKELLAVMDDLDRVIAHHQTQIDAIAITPPPQLSFWQQLTAKPDAVPTETTATYLAALTSNQEGIEMIRRSLLTILRHRQITPILALGEPFDSQCMYAIAQQPSDSTLADRVIQEVVRGYRQGDRILREAQVIVASKSIKA
jgi:molecular chaperone GrpE